MGETLDALRRLQEVELQLAAIRQKREVKSRRYETQKRKAKQAENGLDTHRRRTQERQKTLDLLSLEVASRELSVNKHREALNKAKTNKEYAAILQAINTEKADTAKIESSILEIMDEMQRLETQEMDFEAEKATLLHRIEESRKILEAFDKGSSAELRQLEARAAEFSQSIAPGTLLSFKRVAERHDGEALAAVTKLHPKREDYVCSGCNMKITLETLNTLQTRDEIQLCDSCGRILYRESAAAAK
ncbi:MAG: hypothetical protein IH987_14450 [Planctomycetes bacterium]|nr:hypothetical protein [Planctomycetota bacterium]